MPGIRFGARRGVLLKGAGAGVAAIAPPGLFSWGLNVNGQLGLGNTTTLSSPVQVGALATWSKLSEGYKSSHAIKTDGTLWSWGFNNAGQGGLGNTTAYSSPKQVGALTTWATVSSGGYSTTNHTLAIKTDGTLWSWGSNQGGKLGLGNLTSYSSPKQIGALTTWSKVSVGENFSLAIKTDGTLWSWGIGNYGKLGLGNTTDYSSPKQVGALTTWATLAAGAENFSVAIKTDGTLWSWGKNNYGTLGLGNTTNYSSPKQVGALTAWATVVAGSDHTLSIKTDGTLWSWGRNQSFGIFAGRLGDGTTTTRSSPVQIGALTTWSKVAAGSYHSLAIKTDGTLWSWGASYNGPLGHGNATNYSSPVQVGALTTWTVVASGFRTTLAIKT